MFKQKRNLLTLSAKQTKEKTTPKPDFLMDRNSRKQCKRRKKEFTPTL